MIYCGLSNKTVELSIIVVITAIFIAGIEEWDNPDTRIESMVLILENIVGCYAE